MTAALQKQMSFDLYVAFRRSARSNRRSQPFPDWPGGGLRTEGAAHRESDSKAAEHYPPRRFALSDAWELALVSRTASLLRTFRNRLTGLAAGFFMLAVLHNTVTGAAPLPAEWQHEQRFEVPATGLMKLSLPMATLDTARPGLEDLRLYDDAGHEVPYLIERPKPAGRIIQEAKSFQVSVDAAKTVLTLETGLAHPLDGVTLETPASSFLKAVRIEGSLDGQGWQTLAQGQPDLPPTRRRETTSSRHSRRHVAVAEADCG